MQHCKSPAHSMPVRYSPRLRANWRGTHGHQCRQKTTPFYRILSTPASKSADRDPESRQKQRLSPNFCLLPHPNPAHAGSKVDKKRTVLPNFVYYRIQIRPARLRSRQKMRFPTEFCLPLRPNPHTASQSDDRISPPLHAHPKNLYKKRPDTMPGLISLFS